MYDAVEGTQELKRRKERKSLNSGRSQPQTNSYTFHAADMTAWVGKTW